MSKTNRIKRYRASAQSTPGVSPSTNQSAPPNQVTYPELARYATDLTELARAGRLEPVMGRNAEISRTISILSRDIHQNPVLIGEAGPGVAAIAQGLALRIATGEVPESLSDKRLFSLSLDALAAKAKNSRSTSSVRWNLCCTHRDRCRAGSAWAKPIADRGRNHIYRLRRIYRQRCFHLALFPAGAGQ